MKKFISAAIIVLFAAMTFSCSSDSDGGSNDDMYLRFKVNGTQYNFVDPATIGSLNSTILGYEGMDANFRSMQLQMPNTPTTGSHALTDQPFETDTYGASFTTGDITVDATSGTMNISSIGTEYIKGTFSYTAVVDGVTYNITDGEFRAYTPEEL